MHILLLRQLLRDLGFASDIWCVGAFDDVRSECQLLEELRPEPRPGAWWLYHMSNGSPAADVMKERPEPLLIDYHNITPGELFSPWVDWAVSSAHLAREQLAGLTDAARFAFADSAFNESELTEIGCKRTAVVPPLFDVLAVAREPDQAVLADLRRLRCEGGSQWLFVGRVAPPKAHHDLIKAFACYRRFYDPHALLHLVGPWMGEEYPRALMRFADRLGLGTSVRLTGAVSDEVLGAYYSAADVFVSLSAHEGFCIPLLEAMHFGVPVVAYRAGAVQETAQSAALVLEEKTPLAVAAAVARVTGDASLASRLVRRGRDRAAAFTLERSRRRWGAALEEALEVEGEGKRR